MDVIIIRLFPRGREIGQLPVRRLHDHGLAARLVIKRLLPFDVEGRHDCVVPPYSLEVGVPIGLPGRFELRRLSERGDRKQKQEESHLESLPAYRARPAPSTHFIPVDWYKSATILKHNRR